MCPQLIDVSFSSKERSDWSITQGGTNDVSPDHETVKSAVTIFLPRPDRIAYRTLPTPSPPTSGNGMFPYVKQDVHHPTKITVNVLTVKSSHKNTTHKRSYPIIINCHSRPKNQVATAPTNTSNIAQAFKTEKWNKSDNRKDSGWSISSCIYFFFFCSWIMKTTVVYLSNLMYNSVWGDMALQLRHAWDKKKGPISYI